jgi:CMP-N,N'-diacetyllegionaminic acid synthase
MTDVLCIIIGRRGSKGVPGKNARIIAGLPCAAWSIRHAKASRSIDRIVVSTDCPDVTAAARAEGVEVVDRPADLAGDTATVDAAARHAYEALSETAPIVVLLYGNVPVRPADLLDRAIDQLRTTGADSVQSYAPVGKYHPLWMTKLDDAGRVSAYEESRIYRRQDLPPVYIPDGGVIAVTRSSLFTVQDGEPHAFLGADRRGVINEAGAVVDIDSPIDVEIASAILAEQKRGSAT